MKLSTIVGIVGMLAAMVLYSIGAWGAFRAKAVRRKDVYFLIGGVIFDIVGTMGMYVTAGNRFLWEAPHTWAALVAFFGMALVAVFGLLAVGWNKDKLAGMLSKLVLAPWALWALVFVWGFAQRPGK